MTQILEYINNHPKEIKRVIGITDEQFEKLVGNAQKRELKKRQAIASQEKRLIKAGGVRKKNYYTRVGNHLNFILFTPFAHIPNTRNILWCQLINSK